jgi:hypothetical protein
MEEMETKIRAIITGATGMVGDGVMYECLLHPSVASVLGDQQKALWRGASKAHRDHT